MLRLALPLVMAELGWMSMGVVDTIMVGHLPRPAVTISAVALGQVLYNTLAFGVGGVLLGLDTYISQAHGAGEWDDANRWLLSGVVLAAMLSALLMGMVRLGPMAMAHCRGGSGRREVMRQAMGFLSALNWGTLPLFLYMTFRRYLQAFNHVRPIAAAVVSANVVNAGLDWLLLFGHRLRVAGHVIGIRRMGWWARRGRRRWRGCTWRRLWARRCGGWTGSMGMGCGRWNACWTALDGAGASGWCGWALRWAGRSLWRLRFLRR